MNRVPTVLVTGAEGLVGRHIVRVLVDAGACQVAAVSRSSAQPAAERLTWVKADLQQAAEVLTMERIRADAIVHTAAVLPRTHNDAAAAAANQAMDEHVFALARESNASVIYISSLSVYEDCSTPWTESTQVHPMSAYAASKYRSERALQALGLRGAILRISSPYSAFDISRPGVLYHFVREAVAERRLVVNGKGERAQDFVHGSDIGRAVVAVLQYWQAQPAKTAVETFNIAAGRPTSMTELAELVVSCSGASGIVVHEGAEAEPSYRAELSVSRAKEILQWQPQVELRAGLEQLIRHMRGSYEDWLAV